MTVVYEKLISEIEALIQLYMTNQRILSNTPQPANLHSVLEAMMTLRRSRDIVTAANIVNKVNYIFVLRMLVKCISKYIFFFRL